ncbi:MAG: DUF3905 domain-containing protein [Alicyclobacillus sp.]|nr:DUF3905 domain-containing protein [Alicyclobacillus sp.]
MKRRPVEQLPPWRETPLDHWSTDIDPAIMAGDEWVDEKTDPGTERWREMQGGTMHGDRFMHPTHDTTFGLEDDAFLSDPE